MPFTFSHPAAVLPIHSRFKNWIPLSALVIGSLVPDAAYYLPLPEHFKQVSHTLLGTFSSSLPAGIFVWLIFCWLAAPAVFLLPDPHREAIWSQRTPRLATVQQALGVTSGILIGAWSHVLWDSFTHERGWFVKHALLLQRPFFGTLMPAYKALQYLSSVFGLCVVLYAYNKWMNASGLRLWMWRRPSWRFYLWLGVTAICLVAAAIQAHAINAIASLYFLHRADPAFEFFTTFVRNILVALCAVSISAKLLGSGKTRGRQPSTLP
jgi:fumarate reductase subunit C